MKNKIIMRTNTAYLLNTWFNGKECLWKTIQKFLKEKHDNLFKEGANGYVEVTFRVLSKEDEIAEKKERSK